MSKLRKAVALSASSLALAAGSVMTAGAPAEAIEYWHGQPSRNGATCLRMMDLRVEYYESRGGQAIGYCQKRSDGLWYPTVEHARAPSN